MKKTTLINSELSYVVAQMGHFDTLAIGDAGLPIPQQVKRVDLAVTQGCPTFRQVFYAVMEELAVQKAVIAQETSRENPELYRELTDYCRERGIVLEELPNEELKRQTQKCRAVVRTGECKPYANIILESNVAF